MEQLEWVKNDKVVGVGVWDAALTDPAWQTSGVWQTLKTIKNTPTAIQTTLTIPKRVGGARGEYFDLKGAKLVPNGLRYAPGIYLRLDKNIMLPATKGAP